MGLSSAGAAASGFGASPKGKWHSFQDCSVSEASSRSKQLCKKWEGTSYTCCTVLLQECINGVFRQVACTHRISG